MQGFQKYILESKGGGSTCIVYYYMNLACTDCTSFLTALIINSMYLSGI